MAFRDWLDITLTNFGVWLGGVGDRGLTNLWYAAYYRRVDLDRDRENVTNGVRNFFAWLPDLLGFARDWLTSLMIGYVVDPVYNVLSWPFSLIMARVDDLWWPEYGHYTPVKYALDALYTVKDRLLDLVDFATTLVDGVRSYLTGLLTDAYNALVGFINGTIASLTVWTTWVRDTVWERVQGLTVGLATTNRMLTQVYNDVEAIRRDPPGWIWQHLEPALRERVEGWLDRIWYS